MTIKKILSSIHSKSESMAGRFIRYFLAASLIPLVAITVFVLISNVYTTELIQRYFAEATLELTQEANSILLC